jgi:hypothetical protein
LSRSLSAGARGGQPVFVDALLRLNRRRREGRGY